MALIIPWPFLLLITLTFTATLLVHVTHSTAHQVDTRKVHIVYMGDQPKQEASTKTKLPDLHVNMLQSAVDSSNIAHESLLLHSYKKSFNGFAAKLTDEEAQKIAGMDGVVSVFPSQKHKLHTTRSWDFIGLTRKVKRNAIESDIIVGVIDSGAWPESASFSGTGFRPAPKKWKGICQGSNNFTCNNKLIGARYYHKGRPFKKDDVQSPRDDKVGHGTHTASTAAGNFVSKASLFGLGEGTARGGVPSARIAVYKVCWAADECEDADILAAFDDAIADGVDIISLSLGGLPASDYFRDSNSIGAFHALRRGILTSAAVGNSGPALKTIANFAPWILSVAASTIDRHFTTKVQLGNHKVYEGIVTNTFDLKRKFYPIIYAGDAPNKKAGADEGIASTCQLGSLDENLVKGKIVLCSGTDGIGAAAVGAAGVVLQSRPVEDVLDPLPIPSSALGLDDGNRIYYYINSTRNPTATIFRSYEDIDPLSPYVPAFSSRGPNPSTPNLLKPDLAAPGASILAAWPPVVSPSPVDALDHRVSSFNIKSGTSMACPHASGAAAYVKSFHLNWSPAAIQSALITTAKPLSANVNPDAEFAYGAGNIDPIRALNPGLVYDANELDYVNFLCAQGYSSKLLQAVTGHKSTCSPQSTHEILSDHLNYPSFALPTRNRKSVNGIFNRTVTNVGTPKSTYKAKVSAPQGLQIKVTPSILSFTSLGQKRSFQLTIKGSIYKPTITSASIVWDDGRFQVRSPIVVYVVF